MSIVISPVESLPVVLPYQPARMSVADYHRLIDSGMLTENNRLELLRGVMVEQMTHNPLHAALVGLIHALLHSLVPPGFHLRCQVPITLADSEPEPDVAVVRGRLTDYFKNHPGPSETPLVIEISSSSLVTDRYKAEIYAEAGIPCYWIVNLVARQVEVYSQPSPTAEGIRYGVPRLYQPDEIIPVILDGSEVGTIAAEQLLPELGK